MFPPLISSARPIVKMLSWDDRISPPAFLQSRRIDSAGRCSRLFERTGDLALARSDGRFLR